MTEAERAAALAGEARTHALVRTSPMGGAFRGTCIQCGTEIQGTFAEVRGHHKPCGKEGNGD